MGVFYGDYAGITFLFPDSPAISCIYLAEGSRVLDTGLVAPSRTC